MQKNDKLVFYTIYDRQKIKNPTVKKLKTQIPSSQTKGTIKTQKTKDKTIT